MDMRLDIRKRENPEYEIRQRTHRYVAKSIQRGSRG